MNVTRSINKLRFIALFLFLVPAVGLLGSLFIHNYLVSFKFDRDFNYNFAVEKPGARISIMCTELNDYCRDENFQKFSKLGDCYQNKLLVYYSSENGDILSPETYNKNINDFKRNVYYNYELSNELSDTCILNSNKLPLYNLFPFYFESIYKLKNNKKTVLGTSVAVNPFFKGETSISNIVKRYPIKFFFKPIMYITIILMIFYWYNFNIIFKTLINQKENFYFFYFGILSAIFLFLHILFLGWTFENDFLTKLRRKYIVFFILFEILSQAFLINKILSIKDKFQQYLNSLMITLKLLFVLFICSSSGLILVILIFYNLSSKLDYILEWNYFLILLIFYFLSYLMWKKSNVNPPSA